MCINIVTLNKVNVINNDNSAHVFIKKDDRTIKITYKNILIILFLFFIFFEIGLLMFSTGEKHITLHMLMKEINI